MDPLIVAGVERDRCGAPCHLRRSIAPIERVEDDEHNACHGHEHEGDEQQIRHCGHGGTPGAFSPDSDFAGRCIGVYAYSGTLSVGTVGTGADNASSGSGTVSLATPAGAPVVAGASLGSGSMGDPGDEVTPDGDWSAMIPATNTGGGAGINGKAVYAQQLASSGAATWTPTHGPVDWAAIAVGYTRT